MGQIAQNSGLNIPISGEGSCPPIKWDDTDCGARGAYHRGIRRQPPAAAHHRGMQVIIYAKDDHVPAGLTDEDFAVLGNWLRAP
jgi:hypothetical protein